ncbi:hypothetical protein V5O48_019454, partial [Marasmius crinis-equi]
MYNATNKKNFEPQVAKHVARQRNLHQKASRSDWTSHPVESEDMPPDDPASHILMPHSERNPMRFGVLLDPNQPTEPALENFKKGLQRHLLGRILEQDPDTIPDSELYKVAFVGDRFFRHKRFQVNYTT